MDHDHYLGKINRIVPDGKHGPYAVANVEGLKGSVTFSLNPGDEVWQEDFPLSHENHCNLWIVLSGVARKDRGWRAMCARVYTPADKSMTLIGKGAFEREAEGDESFSEELSSQS